MMRQRTALLLALWTLLFPVRAGSAGKEVLSLLTVDPALSLMVRFIGGPYVETDSGAFWDVRDELRCSRGRVLGDKLADRPLVALDEEQYRLFLERARGSRKKRPLSQADLTRPRLVFLYPGGTGQNGLTDFYADPARLPFTAQKVMNLLCELAPERVSYFQRRLGEFCARLRATLISGRALLSGRQIFCMSPDLVPFLKASGCAVSEPSETDWEQFRLLCRTENPKHAQALAQPYQEGSLIVMDYTVPQEIRETLTLWCGALYMPPPRDEDWLYYLHRWTVTLSSFQKRKTAKK